LPLKTDDLKTVDTYKKAIKQDVSRISPQGGTKFWVYKDVELPTASGGKQKLPTFIALVDDNAIKALLKGKPPLCRGTCGILKDKITFEPSQGKVPYQLMKTSVPLLLGKPVHIPSGEDTEDAEGARVAPPAPPSPQPSNPAQAQSQVAAWKKLEERLKQAIAQHPERKDELIRAGAAIVETLRTGKGQLAEQLMAKATALLDSIGKDAGGTPHPGIVKYRGALLQFAQAKSTVQAQIAGLRSAMAKQFPGEADFASGLAAELNELNDELAAAVDEAMNAARDEAAPATDAIRSKIRKYMAEVAASPVVQKVDSNPLGVPVTIGKTLGEALGRIRDAMPA
jgi:hypothetical protein